MAHRLAAILAADVVGYSRLLAAEEAGTHARLKALRQDFIDPKVAEHRGRVAKLMGDGALVEFASVVDAAECAVAVNRYYVPTPSDFPYFSGSAPSPKPRLPRRRSRAWPEDDAADRGRDRPDVCTAWLT